MPEGVGWEPTTVPRRESNAVTWEFCRLKDGRTGVGFSVEQNRARFFVFNKLAAFLFVRECRVERVIGEPRFVIGWMLDTSLAWRGDGPSPGHAGHGDMGVTWRRQAGAIAPMWTATAPSCSVVSARISRSPWG